MFYLKAEEHELQFTRVPLTFLEHGLKDIFARKNNKTVHETLTHKRYALLAPLVSRDHAAHLNMSLGSFLFELKCAGNPTYKRFLNAYGDQTYCQFRMDSSALSLKKGLYCYCLEGHIVYLGRTFDPFAKRVNQG